MLGIERLKQRFHTVVTSGQLSTLEHSINSEFRVVAVGVVTVDQRVIAHISRTKVP
jgi:hypothetical protein